MPFPDYCPICETAQPRFLGPYSATYTCNQTLRKIGERWEPMVNQVCREAAHKYLDLKGRVENGQTQL